MPLPQFVACDDPRIVEEIKETLQAFGGDPLRFAQRAGIRGVPLNAGERYTETSSALRRLGIEIDDWPVPPAGLFVVEERTIYLRSYTRMTIAHEFGHALDCA